MEPHRVIQRGHHRDIGFGPTSCEPGTSVGQWHRVQQVVIRSIGDDTLMQRESVSKLTLAFDPKALSCPYRWVYQLFEAVALRVLKVQRYRLASTKRSKA